MSSVTLTQPPNKPGTAPHSNRGKWRALVLLLVHVLIAIHIWHWQQNTTTLTPVEPSESMQTLETGAINAGFIFFALSILSTLIFGRWMCGWMCHIVALQDACSWLLKKFHISSRPIRSRLLVWVPVLAALYMFVWPQVDIWLGKRPRPAWVWHLTSDSFWATFPSLPVALLTFFVCGFLIVYVLGNKAFCTYGCPYGGVFYWADKLAPGKIRVTDACNSCGHCTAVCTSNVRVHEEVKSHRMVVDAGCMKCMDCVDACPTSALYFGFGRPTVGAKPLVQLAQSKAKSYDYTWPEEVALVGLFGAAFYAFRGLYDLIPFLLSLGLAAIFAFGILHAFQLAYKPNIRFQRIQLKAGGKIKAPGIGAAVIALASVGFAIHSSLVQYHSREADRLFSQVQIEPGSTSVGSLPPALEAAKNSYQLATKLALVPTAEWHARLGILLGMEGQNEESIAQFQRALDLDPDRLNTRRSLLEAALRAENLELATQQIEVLSTKGVDVIAERQRLAGLLAQSENLAQMVTQYEAIFAAEPKNAKVAASLGLLYAQTGQLGKAKETLRAGLKENPQFAPLHLNYGLVLAADKDFEASEGALRKAIELDSSLFQARNALAIRLASSQRAEEALTLLEEGMRLYPGSNELIAAYQGLARDAGQSSRAEAFLKNLNKN